MSSVNIAILAGGQSKRMGTDKGFLLLHGKPILEHVLDSVAPLGFPIVLVTNSPSKYTAFQLPMVADILPEHGSLGGIYTALASSKVDYTLCVACDMPFLNTALLKQEIKRCEAWDAVVPQVRGFPETLHAVYGRTCLIKLGKPPAMPGRHA